MNQILGNDARPDFSYLKKSAKNFKIIFWIFIFIFIFSIILFFLLKYNSLKREKVSKKLIDSFNITTLYSNKSNYSANFANYNLTHSNNSDFVIGLIKIDKINLLYPILSEASDNSLSIAPCRFYGPMPNQIGNLCIAGHNNANNTLFGKLDVLEKNDIVKIYDLNGSYIDYYIYEIKRIKSNDTSCIDQNTNGLREISLITCNSLKNDRLLIKAKEGSS